MATTKTTNAEIEATENWDRYNYGRTRGHLQYMEQAERNDGMYLGAGRQWRDEDKAALDRAHRPWYEFNEIMPSVNAALGYQIHNRMDIAFKPRGGEGDLNRATVLSKVVMQIADQQKLHWKETQVCADGLIEQRGYWDVRMNFDRNILGEVDLTFLDPRDVVPDPDAKSYDPDEWSDVLVTRWLTLDEINRLYGKKARKLAKESSDQGSDWGEDDDGVERNKFGDLRNSSGVYDAYKGGENETERYRVIERQMAVYEMTDCMVFPDTGDVVPVSRMTDAQLADAQAKGAINARRMQRRIKWVVSTYSRVLFSKYSPYEHFTIVPYFAIFRRGQTRGIVDNAISPQEVLNKAVSQNIHIVNSAANSGWVVEEDSLTNMDTEDLRETGAMTGLVVEFKKGSTKPDKIEANAVPTGVDKLIDRASKALKDVTVPEEARGLNGGKAQSGVAIQSEQFASQQQIAIPLDNLAYTRHLLASRILKLVQRYYDSYRVFRITETDPLTGKKVEQTLEINKFDPATGEYFNDLTVGTYDVVITEQPMQITFANSQFTQALEMKKAGLQIPDWVLIRYSNLADKQEIMESMKPAPTDPTLEAKARLIDAQARKAEAETTSKSVETQYSAIQTAQVIAQTPATSGLADALLRSAGYVDKDLAPIIPQLPPGAALDPAALPENTNPLTPANPGVGLNAGIETPVADGLL